jgi:hypothetical protein
MMQREHRHLGAKKAGEREHAHGRIKKSLWFLGAKKDKRTRGKSGLAW